jgi:hypothetical protein
MPVPPHGEIVVQRRQANGVISDFTGLGARLGQGTFQRDLSVMPEVFGRAGVVGEQERGDGIQILAAAVCGRGIARQRGCPCAGKQGGSSEDEGAVHVVGLRCVGA